MIIIDPPYRGVCDFCGGYWPIVATLRCRPFSIVYSDGNTYLDDGQWDACAFCLPLVDKGDVEGLIARNLAIDSGPLPVLGTVDGHRLLSSFMANRL